MLLNNHLLKKLCGRNHEFNQPPQKEEEGRGMPADASISAKGGRAVQQSYSASNMHSLQRKGQHDLKREFRVSVG